MDFSFSNEVCKEVVDADLRERADSGKFEVIKIFQEEMDRICDGYTPDRRSAPVGALYQRFFRLLGYAERIEGFLREMNGMPGPLSVPCEFSRVHRAEEEGIRFDEDKTRLDFRIQPSTVRDEKALSDVLRSEWSQARDVLDPAFGRGGVDPLTDNSPVVERFERSCMAAGPPATTRRL